MASKKAATKKAPAKKAAPKEQTHFGNDANYPPNINKSAWVRAQPTDTPAADVVAKAKSEGIVMSVNYVYSVRQSARKAAGKTGGPKTTSKKGPGRPPATSKTSGGIEMQLVTLVLDVGITRSEELIAQLKGQLRGIQLR